jgi:Protein ENHANCED DISEASE RESISTANCE 2, C-terminal
MLRRAQTPAASQSKRRDTRLLSTSVVSDLGSAVEHNLWDATPVAANTSSKRTASSSSSAPRRSSLGDVASEFWAYVTSCGVHDTLSAPCAALSDGGAHHKLSPLSYGRFRNTCNSTGNSHLDVLPTGRATTMRIKTAGRTNQMNDMDPPKSDALSTAATEEDDLDELDLPPAPPMEANGPTIALSSNSTVALPTYTRHSETPSSSKKNTLQNCFSEPPLTLFSVRGPNYLTDHKKVPSGPYLLAARGLDLFLTDKQHPLMLDQMYVVRAPILYQILCNATARVKVPHFILFTFQGLMHCLVDNFAQNQRWPSTFGFHGDT